MSRLPFVVVRPVGYPVTHYALVDDPTVQWRVGGSATTGNIQDEQRYPLVAKDGSILIAGHSRVAGGLNSVRLIDRANGIDIQVMRSFDLGQQTGDNRRARWVFQDGSKIEVNPTMRGGTAGTARIYPSPFRMDEVNHAPAWISIESRRGPVMDFDPNDLENRGWGMRPLPAGSPADAQIMWPRVEQRTDDHLDVTDGLHMHRFIDEDEDGSPSDAVFSPNGEGFEALASSFYLTDQFHGGCDLIDMLSGAVRELRGEEWMGVARQSWNGVEGNRLDYLLPGQPAQRQNTPWPSKHACAMLYTGRDGVPDGVAAIGFYTHLKNPGDRLEVKQQRNPALVTDATTQTQLTKTNSGQMVIVGRQVRAARVPGVEQINYWWSVGTPAQVRSRLESQARDIIIASGVAL